MHIKKAATLLVAIIFLASSFTVLAGSARGEGKHVDKIRFEVRTTMQIGIGDTATGDIDVFTSPVSGDVYDGLSDEWKSQLGTWKSTRSYNNMLLNPCHDKQTGLPVMEVSDQYQFNPFGVREIRFAVNHLMNRKHIVEDMYNGYANPRYTAIGVDSPGYDQYFEPIIKDELGITYSGDFQTGYQIVQDAMRKVQEELENDTSLYGDDYGELRLQDPGSDAGENNKWQYKPPSGSFSNVEIISLNRIEDTRLQIGHYFTDQMEKVGFNTIDRDFDRSDALGIAFYSDPANLDWHSYTGGWLSSSAQKYQEEAVNQMYAPWYGYMPGYPSQVDPSPWRYENETLDTVGRELYNGRISNETVYWDLMQKMVRTGVKESVRVFLASTIDFYVYDHERVVSAATNVVTGWSSVFGPRTLKIDSKSDTVQAKFGQYSNSNLHLESWNRIGGSKDRSNQVREDAVRDYATYTHTSSGEPIPMRADWEIVKNFEWKNDVKHKNLDVPENAVKYDTEDETWKEVGSGHKSAIAVTYDWNYTGNGTGTWQDGHELTERDILAWYAFSKEVSYQDSDGDYYFGRWASVQKSWFDTITGVEWGEDDGVYTIYGNYTFPADSKIGNYYGITPYKPWQINEAAQQMIEGSNVSASSFESWDWNDAAENWIHFLDEQQCEKFNTTMENMVNQDWIPEYLKSENNCPLPITTAEMEDEISNIQSFYNTYDHMFDSQGPFKITNVDESNDIMEMERHTVDDGYPLPKDYWPPRLRKVKFKLGTPDIPSFAHLGEDIPVGVNGCRINQDYPVSAILPPDEGYVTFSLLNGSEKIVEVEGRHISNGTFAGTIPGSATENLTQGGYTVKITGKVSGSIVDTITTTILLGPERDLTRVEELQVTPTSGQIPLDFFIEARLVNPTNYSVDVPVKLDDSEIESFSIAPGEEKNVSLVHTIEQIGTYTVDVGDASDDIIGQTMEVTATNDSDIHVSNLDVRTAGKELNITADIENTAERGLSVDVEVGATLKGMQTVDTMIVAANSTTPISTVHEVNETGDYKVLIEHRGSIVTVTRPKPEFELIEPLEISKDGLEVTVTATVQNTGLKEGTVYIWVDEKMIGNQTIAGGENVTFEITHEFDSKGEYKIDIGLALNDTLDEKVIEVKKGGGDTPGFMLVFLVISVLTAAIIYRKKS